MDGAISRCNNTSLQQVLFEKYPLLKYEVSEDCIGIYDNVFDKSYCDSWIKSFEEANANGLSYSRQQGMNVSTVNIADQSIDYQNARFYHDHDMKIQCSEFNVKFWDICYALYAEKFSILKSADMHKIYTVKVQRTRPKEGYHVWHCEDLNRVYRNRLLTFIVYLNDIEDGGETEFLYLSKRVKPVEGRVVIWPSGFTHTHRGNPPLKDTKYIITGWVEF